MAPPQKRNSDMLLSSAAVSSRNVVQWALTCAGSSPISQRIRSRLCTPCASSSPLFSGNACHAGSPPMPPVSICVSRIANTRPMRPSWMMRRAVAFTMRKRCVWATMRFTPAERQAAIISSHSVRLGARGFSTNTCLPHCAAATVCAACSAWGVFRITASISVRASKVSTDGSKAIS